MAKFRRRTSGLVIGHLERVSGAVFDTYSREITELVGNRHGIYALYRNHRLYYVGLARNLRGRVKHHLKDRHKGKWNYFSMYLVRSKRNLKDLESLAIRIAYPKGNKTRGKFGGAPDLRKMLQKRMKGSAIAEINELMGRSAEMPAEDNSRRSAAMNAWRTRRSREGNQEPVLKGLLTQKSLRMRYKGKTYRAWIYASGRIRLRTGEMFDSPSMAAQAIRKKHSNGWYWWQYKNSRGEWVRLQDLRST